MAFNRRNMTIEIQRADLESNRRFFEKIEKHATEKHEKDDEDDKGAAFNWVDFIMNIQSNPLVEQKEIDILIYFGDRIGGIFELNELHTSICKLVKELAKYIGRKERKLMGDLMRENVNSEKAAIYSNLNLVHNEANGFFIDNETEENYFKVLGPLYDHGENSIHTKYREYIGLLGGVKIPGNVHILENIAEKLIEEINSSKIDEYDDKKLYEIFIQYWRYNKIILERHENVFGTHVRNAKPVNLDPEIARTLSSEKGKLSSGKGPDKGKNVLTIGGITHKGRTNAEILESFNFVNSTIREQYAKSFDKIITIMKGKRLIPETLDIGNDSKGLKTNYEDFNVFIENLMVKHTDLIIKRGHIGGKHVLYEHQFKMINQVLHNIHKKNNFLMVYRAMVGAGKTFSINALAVVINSLRKISGSKLRPRIIYGTLSNHILDGVTKDFLRIGLDNGPRACRFLVNQRGDYYPIKVIPSKGGIQMYGETQNDFDNFMDCDLILSDIASMMGFRKMMDRFNSKKSVNGFTMKNDYLDIYIIDEVYGGEVINSSEEHMMGLALADPPPRLVLMSASLENPRTAEGPMKHVYKWHYDKFSETKTNGDFRSSEHFQVVEDLNVKISCSLKSYDGKDFFPYNGCKTLKELKDVHIVCQADNYVKRYMNPGSLNNLYRKNISNTHEFMGDMKEFLDGLLESIQAAFEEDKNHFSMIETFKDHVSGDFVFDDENVNGFEDEDLRKLARRIYRREERFKKLFSIYFKKDFIVEGNFNYEKKSEKFMGTVLREPIFNDVYGMDELPRELNLFWNKYKDFILLHPSVEGLIRPYSDHINISYSEASPNFKNLVVEPLRDVSNISHNSISEEMIKILGRIAERRMDDPRLSTTHFIRKIFGSNVSYSATTSRELCMKIQDTAMMRYMTAIFTLDPVSYIKSTFSELLAENSSKIETIEKLLTEYNHLMEEIRKKENELEEKTKKGAKNVKKTSGDEDSKKDVHGTFTDTSHIKRETFANRSGISSIREKAQAISDDLISIGKNIIIGNNKGYESLGIVFMNEKFSQIKDEGLRHLLMLGIGAFPEQIPSQGDLSIYSSFVRELVTDIRGPRLRIIGVGESISRGSNYPIGGMIFAEDVENLQKDTILQMSGRTGRIGSSKFSENFMSSHLLKRLSSDFRKEETSEDRFDNFTNIYYRAAYYLRDPVHDSLGLEYLTPPADPLYKIRLTKINYNYMCISRKKLYGK